MLIVSVDKSGSIDRALKTFKYKFSRTGVIKEIRRRKQFTKKSAVRREVVIDAKYKQNMRDNNED